MMFPETGTLSKSIYAAMLSAPCRHRWLRKPKRAAIEPAGIEITGGPDGLQVEHRA
jgi:hypothetical protein